MLRKICSVGRRWQHVALYGYVTYTIHKAKRQIFIIQLLWHAYYRN